MSLNRQSVSSPVLRFADFSKTWATQSLSELGAFISDGIHATPIYDESGTYYFINGNNLIDGKIVIGDSTKRVGEVEFQKHKKPLTGDTILMSINGTIGNLAFYEFEKVILGKSACYIILDVKQTDKHFIYFLLQSPTVVRKFHAALTGTTIKNLSLATVKKSKLHVPTLVEQRKIAGFLGAVDGKLERLRRKRELLTEYKRGVMQQIFSQEVRFVGDDGRPFPDWETKKLDQLTILMQSGLSRLLSDTDIGLPVIRSNNIQNGVLDLSDIRYWHVSDPQGANTDLYLLQQGDLLVNFINSIAQIGKVAMVEQKPSRPMIFTTNIMRLRFKDKVESKYMNYFFETENYQKHIQSITKPAVNQASFTKKDFNRLLVPVPKVLEQKKIVEFLDAIGNKIAAVDQQIEQVETFKKGLLQQMFV